jgi:hypothetical protein
MGWHCDGAIPFSDHYFRALAFGQRRFSLSEGPSLCARRKGWATKNAGKMPALQKPQGPRLLWRQKGRDFHALLPLDNADHRLPDVRCGALGYKAPDNRDFLRPKKRPPQAGFFRHDNLTLLCAKSGVTRTPFWRPKIASWAA